MSQTARSKQRTNDPHGTRSKILDAAADLFQSRGYHSTAMQDVRDAAGVTSGALQHHFSSKKALGLAVIDDRVADALRRVWLAPIEEAATAAEGVDVSMGGIASRLETQDTVRGCPVNNLAVELAAADEDFRDRLQSLFGGWQETIAAKIRAGSAAALVSADPETLATFVVAAYSGAMTMAKTEQSTRPLDETRKVLVSILTGNGKAADGRRRSKAAA